MRLSIKNLRTNEYTSCEEEVPEGTAYGFWRVCEHTGAGWFPWPNVYTSAQAAQSALDDALARDRRDELRSRWASFVSADLSTLSEDDLQQAAADGNNAEWRDCAISALAPEHCRGFRLRTKMLAEVLSEEGRAEWQIKYEESSELFRAGCNFGAAVEALALARIDLAGDDAESALMGEVREAWARLGQLTSGEDAPTPEQDAPKPCTVTLDHEDRVELYHMLRGRGGSGLKTKLLGALEILGPKYAAELRKLEAAR